MHFVILGAGAIGGYIGGSLAVAGHNVTFMARPGVAPAARGLRLTLGPGEAAVNILAAVVPPDVALNGAPIDALILAVKAYDTAQALADLRAVTATPPPCLCLQNGVDSEAEVARVFGTGTAIAGTVTTAVSVPARGEVVVEKRRGVGVALGHPVSASLVQALTAAGLRAQGYAAAGPMKWSKLLTNLLGNATSAILDLPVSAVFADPFLFALETAAVREALAVMRAYGYGVVDLPGVPVRLLAAAVRLPAIIARPLLRRAVGAGRGGKLPSLHIDLHAGKPQTEARWLYGAVVKHGAERGVPTPINQLLTDTLEGLTSGALDQAAFRHRPEALLAKINF